MYKNLEELMEDFKNYDTLLSHMVYHIERGVKKAFLLGIYPAKFKTEIENYLIRFTRNDLEICSSLAIPFVIPTKYKCVAVGFCAQPWVKEALEFIYSKKCPSDLYNVLIGMVLDYDAVSIEKFYQTRVLIRRG